MHINLTPRNENQHEALFILSLLRQNFYIFQFHPNSANRQSTKKHDTYQLLYIYSTLPDYGLQICPKHVEVDGRSKLRINGASSWFLLHGFMEMHGKQNIKFSTSRDYISFYIIHWNVLVVSATMFRVPYKNTNNIQLNLMCGWPCIVIQCG